MNLSLFVVVFCLRDQTAAALSLTVAVVLQSELRYYSDPGQHGYLRPACHEPRWIQVHLDKSRIVWNKSQTFCYNKFWFRLILHNLIIFETASISVHKVFPPLYFRIGCGGRTVPPQTARPASELI